jgi:retron-type reverse transcriptase
MNHEWTIKFMEHRVSDNRVLRLIRKWLTAGVSEWSVVGEEITDAARGGIGPVLESHHKIVGVADHQHVPCA